MEKIEQGLAIRGARLERRMTQAHLAAMSGVSEKTIRRAEAGDGIRADSVRAICASLNLDAANLRSEADMRPDVAAMREAEMLRRAWASRAAVVFLALSAVVGPLVAYYRDVIEMRALVGLVALPFFLATPPAAAIFLMSLTETGRRMLAKVPGFPVAGRWLSTRRVALRTVGEIAAFSVLLPCLGLAVHDLVRAPSFWTGLTVVAFLIGATLGCVSILGIVAAEELGDGPLSPGKGGAKDANLASAPTT